MKVLTHPGTPDESDRFRDAEFILQARTRVSEKIAHGEDLVEVLEAIIKTAEEINPDVRASILLVDKDKKVLRCGAAPSLPEFYLQAIDRLPIADNVGACGTAVYRGKTVICEDLQTNPYWTEYRDLAKKAHLGACWSEPIISSSGEVLGSLSFYPDVPKLPTERELRLASSSANQAAIALERDLTQQALTRANAELEDRVKERTAEAERANAIKSQFLAAANHDLRQPLQSLGFYLTALSQRIDSSSSQDIVQKMCKSLGIMNDLVEALLDIATLENGALTPEIQEFSLQVLLDNVIASHQPLADQKGLKLTIDSSPYVVRSDPAMIQRIIENFVANALRYTDIGSVSVTCQRHDDMVRIDVVDTGIGIPADSLDTIFNEYYQLDNSMRDRQKGQGLGLSIVKHIAAILNHCLMVRSVLGEGSTFSLKVPLGESTVLTPPMVKNYPAERAADKQVILLIDDDPLIVDAMRMILESEGITVYTAYDGKQAQEKLKDCILPNLVISDYRLPGQTGVELIRQLRMITHAKLPCILITGDTFNKELARTDLPNCTILFKPIAADQLMAAIEQRSNRIF